MSVSGFKKQLGDHASHRNETPIRLHSLHSCLDITLQKAQDEGLSPTKLIRGILSFAIPAFLFPAAIACCNAAEGFDEDAVGELEIYYLIGLIWLAVSVGLWRAMRPKLSGSASALGLVAVAALTLTAAGVIAWNWTNRTSDFHSGRVGCLLTMSAAAGVGIVGATMHAVIAQIPFLTQRL